jgi:hypothetical protein
MERLLQSCFLRKKRWALALVIDAVVDQGTRALSLSLVVRAKQMTCANRAHLLWRRWSQSLNYIAPFANNTAAIHQELMVYTKIFRWFILLEKKVIALTWAKLSVSIILRPSDLILKIPWNFTLKEWPLICIYNVSSLCDYSTREKAKMYILFCIFSFFFFFFLIETIGPCRCRLD